MQSQDGTGTNCYPNSHLNYSTYNPIQDMSNKDLAKEIMGMIVFSVSLLILTILMLVM